MFESIRTAAGLHFIIGMVGRTPEGPLIEGGIRAQTRRSLERIDEVLASVAGSRDDIVRVRFFLTDMRLWLEARDEVSAFFNERIPPATAVGVTQLVEPGMLIEIEVEAAAR